MIEHIGPYTITREIGRGGMAMLRLASRDLAKDMMRVQQVGEHTIRRVRKDDDSLGETVQFELGEDGAVRRFKQHSIWVNKLR